MSSPSDPAHFRRVLGHHPTGVSIVTSRLPDGRLVGLTVGSFNSVSLAPPLVGFFPDKHSTTWPKIASVGKFCVNVLADDQEALCRRFASRDVDKFAGISHGESPAGLPVFDGVVAWIECTLHAVHEAGDHLIVLGEVDALDVKRAVPPLIFLRGGYGRMSVAD